MEIYFSVTLLLVVISFIGGLKLSDHYHNQAREWEKYALQKQYLRLLAGCDADDPTQPYVSPPDSNRRPIPLSFLDHMQKNGSATMQIKP